MARKSLAVEVRDGVSAKTKEHLARIKELERLVDKQAEQIERISKAKYRLPKAPSRAKSAAAYSRVIIPDTHGCFVDEAALAAFLKDLESLSGSVRQIVMTGDHVDAGGFLAQHHTLGYVSEANYTFEDDTNAANTLLDEIQRLCPKAEIHYLEGNHERRIEKWCISDAVRNARDCKFLLKMFGTENVLHLEKRGIKYYKQGVFYHDCRIPATIKLGRCHFSHGSRTGVHSARAMLNDFGACVVYGHVHSMDSASGRTVDGGEIGAWTPGCLCRKQPLWMHTQITRWTNGYGLQLVRDDERFMHINVPIIEGESYLIQLTEQSA